MPSKYKYIEKKIRKYRKNFSNIKFKEKLMNYVYKIGIYSSKDFELKEDLVRRKIIFPCRLGILFCETGLAESFFEELSNKLNNVFDSFFFTIQNLGRYTFSDHMLKKAVKNANKKGKDFAEKNYNLHSTNKFYTILIQERVKHDLDMIAAITDLPLFSSHDDTILFLFGEAHLKHACCIISTLKLKESFYNRKENQRLLEQRIIKEVIHEIGHFFLGHEHCVDQSCVFCFSNNLDDIDNKAIHFCNSCQQKFEDLKTKFNI